MHISLEEPLLHQIIAVYDAMVPRQPLCFLPTNDGGPVR